MTQTWEKLHMATLTLVGSGPIKQRLAGAYLRNLADLETEDLPKSVQQEFTRLNEALTRVQAINGEGRVQATVRKLSKAQADKYAEQIVLLYDAVSRDERTGKR